MKKRRKVSYNNPMRCSAHPLARRDRRSRAGGGRPRSALQALALAALALAAIPAAAAPGGARATASTAKDTALPSGIALVTLDRRPVAIIDLTGDEGAATVGRALAERLVRHAVLAPLADPETAAALIGAQRQDDQQALDSARRALADANDALARFELAVAAARAQAGWAELHDVEPTAAAIALYADLAFVHGQAKLADSDGPAARSSFLLTQRLDPDRVLDPARYLPDVIAAYRQARRGGGGRMQIEVRGQGIAYVDGVEIGAAPLAVEVATGPHLVQLYGPTRLARGARVEITPTSSNVVVLPEARAPPATIMNRARRALAAAPDATARAGAMAGLARLAGVGDAILLTRGAAGLTAQVWRDRAPGFGPLHPLTDDDPEKLGDLLAELAPEMPGPPPSLQPIQPDETPRWYQRRWVQASMVTGAVAVLAAAVVLSTVDFGEGSVEVNPTPSFVIP